MQMSNRTAKFASAILASLLASTPFTTVSQSAAAECLSGPKGATPEGRHWYYRIDRATQRQCWYLRDEDKESQAAPLDLSPSAKSASPRKETAAPRAIADARAELPLPQTRTEQKQSVFPAPPALAIALDPPSVSVANAEPANTQVSAIASRWPDQSEVSSPIIPQPAATSAPANTNATPTSQTTPPAPVTPVALATADSSSKSRFGSIPMLLTVAMGALSLAAVMGGAIFGFGSSRRTGERDIRRRRRVNWNYPGSEQRTQSDDSPREWRAADDPDRRVAEMLARLSRSAAA
jgi:hypothetical protein